MNAEWKPFQSFSCASLPMLRLPTEAVDYSYDIWNQLGLYIEGQIQMAKAFVTGTVKLIKPITTAHWESTLL